MIYFTGDTHGEQSRIAYLENESICGENDFLIICGDWGYLFRNDDSEKVFLNQLEQKPYTICFVDGNHENFHALNEYPEEVWNGGKIHRIRKNIIHLMRGQVFAIEDKKIFTMGGAYSVDRYIRKLNYSYWEEEIPESGEYSEAIHNLDKHNRCVDYIVTHTAPREMILRMGCRPDPHDMELTGFLEYIMYEVQFRHWYCGHWHRDMDMNDKFTVLWYNVVKAEM